ncbi:hypothetical protein [Streptomyces oceani]|uniref:hypothetical protein n=1 Tax=Streptomyces oceani TaxID=1075402 RepID=UPI00087335A4|nr:hypothetical protein [Streptomyces oceani]
MSGDADLNVSEAALQQITSGLKAAISELKEAGSTEPSALLGSGFAELELTMKEVGEGDLADAFESFCEHWEWGVRGLIGEANTIADRLNLSAGLMYREERYWEGNFKHLVNSANLTANPGLSREEVARQGWEEIIKADDPDYSGESIDRGREEADRVWAQANSDPEGRFSPVGEPAPPPAPPPVPGPGAGPQAGPPADPSAVPGPGDGPEFQPAPGSEPGSVARFRPVGEPDVPPMAGPPADPGGSAPRTDPGTDPGTEAHFRPADPNGDAD